MSEIDLDFYEKELNQWEISLYDLVKHPLYKEWMKKNIIKVESETVELINKDSNNAYLAFAKPPRDLWYAILYKLGLNPKHNFEIQLCRHKSWDGTELYGERIVGVQRDDEKWKQSIRNL